MVPGQKRKVVKIVKVLKKKVKAPSKKQAATPTQSMPSVVATPQGRPAEVPRPVEAKPAEVPVEAKPDVPPSVEAKPAQVEVEPTPEEQRSPLQTPMKPEPSRENYYVGGWSQWREEASEKMWDQWDWPPYGWQPSSWQDAYWNQDSKYHAYRDYNWSPEESLESRTVWTGTPKSGDSCLSRSGSMDVEVLREQLSRSNTGSVADFNMMLEQVATPTEKEKSHEPSSTPTSNNSSLHQDSIVPPATPKATDNEEGALAPVESEYTAERTDEKEASEDEKKKKAQAHARYMRYYRNIRSLTLSETHFSRTLEPVSSLH